MTDRYADLRAALADAQSADGDCVMPVIETDALRALLADYDRMRDALLWNAAALNECCKEYVQEVSTITIAAETKCFSEILDMADAALAQEQGGSDGV